jgi:hypothetical protein
VFVRITAEPRSSVTFEIEPAGALVKLTVRHGGFDPGSAVLEGVTDGWPAILSSLKTLLETSEPLPGGGAGKPAPVGEPAPVG